MKHLLLTTIAALLVVGCGESQQSSLSPEIQTAEPVAAAKSKPESPTAKSANPQADRALIEATATGNVEAVKKAITDGADVNLKAVGGGTLLFIAAHEGNSEVAQLLIAKGADVNEKNGSGETPLDWVEEVDENGSPEVKAAQKELSDLLRKHGGKTGEELKAEAK